MVADEEIKHIVLLMMENHSFDQMLGCLQDEYSDLDGVDINSSSPRFNLDHSGNQCCQTTNETAMNMARSYTKSVAGRFL